MKSMTGYGKSAITNGSRQLTIELKTVNNRYLEINSRLPKSMGEYDDIIRKILQEQLNRGSVDVYFNYENNSEDSRKVHVDMELAAEYMKAAKKLRTEFLLNEDFQISALMRSPDVIKVDSVQEDVELLKEMVKKCAYEAVKALNAMREIEGEGIKNDLNRLTTNLVQLLEQAVKRAPKVVEEFRNKLTARIKDALQNVALDESKLINEVAFFADKADINEEISRLTSHINQFFKLLNSDEAIGRKLDFLSQEMNREINTMGSKSNDIELTQIVVTMKNELEKIKEQIRNVE